MRGDGGCHAESLSSTSLPGALLLLQWRLTLTPPPFVMFRSMCSLAVRQMSSLTASRLTASARVAHTVVPGPKSSRRASSLLADLESARAQLQDAAQREEQLQGQVCGKPDVAICFCSVAQHVRFALVPLCRCLLLHSSLATNP